MLKAFSHAIHSDSLQLALCLTNSIVTKHGTTICLLPQAYAADLATEAVGSLKRHLGFTSVHWLMNISTPSERLSFAYSILFFNESRIVASLDFKPDDDVLDFSIKTTTPAPITPVLKALDPILSCSFCAKQGCSVQNCFRFKHNIAREVIPINLPSKGTFERHKQSP